ncbi:MAG: hypothetical protein OXC14_03990, partial [Rhodospirillaceae bacterium]|nr:hypothetical protein [Rhodospirillaceae bacterium]
MATPAEIGLDLTLQFKPCGRVVVRYSHRVLGVTGNKDPDDEPEAEAARDAVSACLRATGAGGFDITDHYQKRRRFFWAG